MNKGTTPFFYGLYFPNFALYITLSGKIVSYMASMVGKIIGELRDQKDWSQGELAAKSGVSREMIGKYERGEAVPSVDAAKKIADAFEVSLDYLAGSTSQLLEKNMLKRINDIQQLPPEDKTHLFALMDAFLRDHKARKVFTD